MGLCSCLSSCLTWGVQHWSLLVIEWSWVLALRWRSLREFSPIDIMRSREVSNVPMSGAWLSHLRISGLTPGWSTKTLSATLLSRPWFMCFPSLHQLLPPHLPLFWFDLYFPCRVEGVGQCRGCQWAAAPPHQQRKYFTINF